MAIQQIARRRRLVARCMSAAAGAFLLLYFSSGATAAAQSDADNLAYFKSKQQKKLTAEDWIRWARWDPKPQFKPGDTLTAKDLDKLRPFIPPEYLPYMDFPEFKMRIVAAVDHTPRRDYVACTEKYAGQVRLQPNQMLANYVCGQPFPNDTLRVDDPTSGLKLEWNYDLRWQNFGLFWWGPGGLIHPGRPEKHLEWPGLEPRWFPPDLFPVRPPNADEIKVMWGGGGYMQRGLLLNYERTYYHHLAQYEGRDLPGFTEKNIQWKEFTGFSSPFDIRGTAFINYRYEDQNRADDAWAYIPVLRRVRRISSEVKSDSLLGTEWSLEDFYGFSGRIPRWKFKFLGWKTVLGTLDSKWPSVPRSYGPHLTNVIDDNWSLRRVAIIEKIPLEKVNPYSVAFQSLDSQDMETLFNNAFDRRGRIWKTFWWAKKWSETYDNRSPAAFMNRGLKIDTWNFCIGTDVQNDRATVWPSPFSGWPKMTVAQVTKLYDINQLEQVHR